MASQNDMDDFIKQLYELYSSRSSFPHKLHDVRAILNGHHIKAGFIQFAEWMLQEYIPIRVTILIDITQNKANLMITKVGDKDKKSIQDRLVRVIQRFNCTRMSVWDDNSAHKEIVKFIAKYISDRYTVEEVRILRERREDEDWVQYTVKENK